MWSGKALLHRKTAKFLIFKQNGSATIGYCSVVALSFCALYIIYVILIIKILTRWLPNIFYCFFKQYPYIFL